MHEVPPDVDFKIPNWAAKAPAGTHLDVFKGDKLLQKLMIDEKKCYFFGRNPQMCDIAVEHASCSRVHAALVHHQHLNRCFLIDLGSAHGTFISNVRLEPNKAEQVLVDQVFHFGASTRRYTLRDKPTSSFYRNAIDGNAEDYTTSGVEKKKQPHFLSLPEKEEELENLTEYNTALNRRISAMTVPEENFSTFRRRSNVNILFKDEEEIINPEDVDPNIGRFRNLVQTAVISSKRPRFENDHYNLSALHPTGARPHPEHPNIHPAHPHHPSAHVHQMGLASKIGFQLNIAPDVELYPVGLPEPRILAPGQKLELTHEEAPHFEEQDELGPKKKKYAKEAWPGKKPGQHLLM